MSFRTIAIKLDTKLHPTARTLFSLHGLSIELTFETPVFTQDITEELNSSCQNRDRANKIDL